jgi:hypothetical protein
MKRSDRTWDIGAHIKKAAELAREVYIGVDKALHVKDRGRHVDGRQNHCLSDETSLGKHDANERSARVGVGRVGVLRDYGTWAVCHVRGLEFSFVG